MKPMLFDRNAGRVAAINIVALLFHVGIHAASDELPKAAAQLFQLYAANVYPTPPALQSDNLVPRTGGHLATVPWLRFALHTRADCVSSPRCLVRHPPAKSDSAYSIPSL